MSLALRRTLYFQNAVTATYRMSPVPTCAAEAEWLRSCFSKVAPVEYFHIEQASMSEQNIYRQKLTVVLSSWGETSMLNMHNDVGSCVQTAGQLSSRRHELSAFLRSICGLPRFSYIDGDENFAAGRTEIRLNATLAKGCTGFSRGFTIGAATQEAPFFIMKSDYSTEEIVPFLRHNFQKFHKLLPLSVRPGVPKHLRPTHSPDIAVNVGPDQELDLAALGDLDHEINIPCPPKKYRHFTGFET